MRKIITSSVLILLFSLFSGSVFAGDKSACAEFKKNKEFKGLYGLCVAYQNADEEGKINIFSNWEKKVGEDGEPQLPGHDYGDDEPVDDLVCPCWPNGELLDAVDPWDYQEFGTFAIATFDYLNIYYLTDTGYCEHVNTNTSVVITAWPTAEQDEKCLDDVAKLIADNFPEAY